MDLKKLQSARDKLDSKLSHKKCSKCLRGIECRKGQLWCTIQKYDTDLRLLVFETVRADHSCTAFIARG